QLYSLSLHDALPISLIVGANSLSSRLNGLVAYAQQVLFEYKIQTQVIQVHMLPAEALMTADYTDKTLQAVNQQVLNSDGVLVFTDRKSTRLNSSHVS